MSDALAVDGAEFSADIAAAAQAYARRGWPIVPLHGLESDAEGNLTCDCVKGAACASPGKHPRITNWIQQATTNVFVVAKWWNKWPNSNVGIATGHEFGVVLDFDPRHDSDESLAALEAAHGPLPETLTTRTGSDGEHRVFQYPEGFNVRCRLPALEDSDGIDVRGDTGLIVAPPSSHVSGTTYQWKSDINTPTVPLPEWLMEGVERDLPAGPDLDYLNVWAKAGLEGECRKVGEAKGGNRNDTLFVSSCRVGEIVAGGGLDYIQAFESLSLAATKCGLDDEESDGVITRGLSAGTNTPRLPRPTITSRDDAMALLDTIQSTYASIPRGGHKGTRMRTCFEAMLSIARDNGGPRNFSATTRQVAIRGGTGESSMHKALAELQNEGWLYRKRKGTPGTPSRWDIRIPTEYKELESCSNSEDEVGKVLGCQREAIHGLRTDLPVTKQYMPIPIGHDAFLSPLTFIYEDDRESKRFFTETLGLNKSAWIVLEYLQRSGGWVRQAEIARATGYNASSIWSVLKSRLIPYDLVEKDPVSKKIQALEVTEEHLQKIAAAFGTDGGHEKRLAQYRSLRDAPVGKALGTPKRIEGLRVDSRVHSAPEADNLGVHGTNGASFG
jgi:hypothetical protein